MSNHVRLHRRKSGRYYCLVWIPKNLQQYFEKKQIWQSLGTSDYSKAVPLIKIESLKWDIKFSSIFTKNSHNKSMDKLSDSTAEAFAIQWLHEEIEYDTRLRHCGVKNGSIAGFIKQHGIEGLEKALSEKRNMFANNDFSEVVDTVDDFINRMKISPNPRNSMYNLNKLEHAFMRAYVQFHEFMLERVKGNWPRTPSVLLRNIAPDIQKPDVVRISSSTHVPAEEKHEGITIAELIEKYKKCPSRQDLSASSEKSFKASHRVLKEFFGAETPITSIDKGKCRDFLQLLIQMPVNAKIRFPKSTVFEAVAKGREQAILPISIKTVKCYYADFSSMLNWAVNNDFLEKNPAKGVQIPAVKQVKAKARRMPFTTEQINKIFHAPLYTGCVDDQNRYNVSGDKIIKRGRYWIPLISLFSGARLNELCQLYVSDIQIINGIDVFALNDEEDKALKADASHRIIPIHPKLKEAGFMEYVASIKERGEKHLFPELPRDKYGNYSSIYSKWFGRFLRSVEAKTEKTSFHSFRHNFRDAMREAEINREVVLSLGGWEGGGGTDAIYGSGVSIKKLNEAICKIEYEGVSLEHLVV